MSNKLWCTFPRKHNALKEAAFRRQRTGEEYEHMKQTDFPISKRLRLAVVPKSENRDRLGYILEL
jgi:hypothetical protein